MAIGIFAGGARPGYGAWALGAALVCVAVLVMRWHRNRRSRWAPLLLMGVVGYASMAPWLPSEFPAEHVFHFTDDQRREITGAVAEMLPPRHGRTRLILKVTQLRGERRVHEVTGRIRVTVIGGPPAFAPGTRLTFSGRIRPFRNYHNPGGFDYRRHMALQRIAGSTFVSADRLHSEGPEKTRPASIMERYRGRARAAVEQLDDVDCQAVMKALLIGDRDAISQDLRRVFNRCGVGHLLAISGLHVGIVGGLVFGGFLWLLHRCPVVLDRGWGRRGAAVLSVGPILFYAILAGMSPATQRALIMVLAFMASYFVDRETDTLNLLAVAALFMLVWKPPALFSISFQMSFAAVFWIVVGLSRTAGAGAPSPGRGSGRRPRIKIFLLVTCWATGGTLPLTMAYFQEVSLIGLAANCLMVPLTGMFVLPAGLLSLFILPVHSDLAHLGIETAGWGLSLGLRLLKEISACEAVALHTFVPTGFETLCYYGVLGMVAMRPLTKHARWVWLIIVVAVCADGLYWGYARFWHRDLRITVLDVGQGSAACVEFPGGHTMLIDGGGTTNNRYFDIGARVVAPFLRSRKIMQVDTVVVSHPSSDHMNGLVYILAHFKPQKLLWTGDRVPTESFQSFFEESLRSGAAVPSWKEVERTMSMGGVVVNILNPPAAANHLQDATGAEYNNRSIVLRLLFGDCAILFPGDIEAGAEAALAARCREQLSSEVLVAPHHGSLTSSSMDFLASIDPDTIIVSAGWRNRFGFPHAAVLQRYRRLANRIYRTDSDGAIRLRTDGRGWKMESTVGGKASD